MIFTFPDLSSDMNSHWDNIDGFLLGGITVSKNLLNWMRNYRDTNGLCRFRIKSTNYACLGEGPRLIPILSLVSHLSCNPTTCR